MLKRIVMRVLRGGRLERYIFAKKSLLSTKLLTKGILLMKDAPIRTKTGTHSKRPAQTPAPLSPRYAQVGAEIAANISGLPVGVLPPPTPKILRHHARRWQQVVAARAQADSILLINKHIKH